MSSSGGARTQTKRSQGWVSNNRFLVGGIKKIPARNPNFEYEETKMLIKIWGEPKLQRTLITSHKKHTVIAQIAERMKSAGYHRSTEEINTRIKNLKCFYNRLKKDAESNGLPSDRHLWKHYHAMDEIMTRPIFSVRPGETPPPAKNWEDRENTVLQEKLNNKPMTIEDSEDEEYKSDTTADDTFDSYSIHEMMDTEMENTGTFENDMMDLHKLNNEGEDVDVESEQKPIIKIKDEPMSDDDEDEPLKNFIVPKKEPIDDIPTPKQTPPVMTTVQSHAGTLSLGSLLTNTVTTPITSTPTSMPQLILQKPMNLPKSVALTGGTTTATVIQQQGKISLVPTSMLIHQQQQQGNINQQPQKIYFQNSTTSTSQVGTATAASIVQTANGMKVLLVNTGKANTPNQQQAILNTNSGNLITQTPDLPKNIPSPSLPPPRPTQNTPLLPKPTPQVAQQRKENSSRFDKTQTPKELAGFRTLLTHLITLQTSNNELERQRLALEKERMEFEKKSVERFFNILPTLFGNKKDANMNNTNTTGSSTSTPIGTENGLQMLIIPKTERIDKDYIE